MKKSLYLITALIIFTGCATLSTPEQIISQANSINTQDGVDKKEAQVLAQNYLIEQNLQERHAIYNIGYVRLEGNDWIVYFKPTLAYGAGELRSRGFTPAATVKVDALSGKASMVSQE